MTIAGSCLCGAVSFSAQRKIDVIYHCHCSLCRKQSGTASNAATLINAAEFLWQQGQSSIVTYKKETGFTSSFCATCGSPVPNFVGQTNYVWIPLGLLNDDIYPKTTLHLCMSSKSLWEHPVSADKTYNELPLLGELQSIFQLR